MLKEGRFPSLHQKRRLEELIKRMRSEAPEDRPSLSDVLAALAGRPVPSLWMETRLRFRGVVPAPRRKPH